MIDQKQKRPQAKKNQHQSQLNDDINAAIASNLLATAPDAALADQIKTRLLQRIRTPQQTFVFAEQGEWNAIAHGVEVKMLHKSDKASAFLMRMAANTSIDGHTHKHDEESFVIDGEVWLEGILCKSGDYHFALAGSAHQRLHTANGCTLLVKNS